MLARGVDLGQQAGLDQAEEHCVARRGGQAKRHALGSTIGRPEIQAFTGSLVGLGASKGVFVTTSAFSAQAIDFASRIPQRVVLINGKRLRGVGEA
jgi:restriction endonuclease Mrr